MTTLDAAWTRFDAAGAAAKDRRIVDLFKAEPQRLADLSLEAAGLRLDLSKQPWSLGDFEIAVALAQAADVEIARDRLFAGEVINLSENRCAMHMALRAPDGADFRAQGAPVSSDVEAARAKIKAFAGGVRSGDIRGADGQEIRAVLHIGIGGSDLGPRLIWEALRPLAPKIELRFVANIDPSELAQALVGLEPATTLVIVVSKTFTTQETLTNATAARAWLRDALGPAADSHLVAVSAAPQVAQAFGVPPENVFAFWDWVGGRYSLWSAVGLSCAIGLGYEPFAELLAGAATMDSHFQSAPLADSLPVRLALAHVFNRNAMGRAMRAVIPYAQRLRLFPAFLQQLEMESNGKQVTQAGEPVARATAASVFGDAGTNGQHAFFQALHQGADVVPVDFVAVAKPREADLMAHAKLLANVVAQAEALMVGRSDLAAPHRNFPGDRPSSFLLLEALTPHNLGALIALYEHKVFVEGVLWGINSFDQWGVELGKTLAVAVLSELQGGAPTPHDPSTNDLISRLKT